MTGRSIAVLFSRRFSSCSSLSSVVTRLLGQGSGLCYFCLLCFLDRSLIPCGSISSMACYYGIIGGGIKFAVLIADCMLLQKFCVSFLLLIPTSFFNTKCVGLILHLEQELAGVSALLPLLCLLRRNPLHRPFKFTTTSSLSTGSSWTLHLVIIHALNSVTSFPFLLYSV